MHDVLSPHPTTPPQEPLDGLRRARSEDELIAAHVTALREACAYEMTVAMERSKRAGDLSDSDTATWVYQLAEIVMSCNKLSALIEKRAALARAGEESR